MAYNTHNDPFHQGTTSLPSKRKRKNKSEDYEDVGFMNQKVNLVDSILFPDGYENIMIAIYFITVPYVVGLLFIFFVIGKGDYTVFLSLKGENSFLIAWAIGYEVVASLLLLWIAKLGLVYFFSVGARNKNSKKFRIP